MNGSLPLNDVRRQRRVGGVVAEVLFAGEEADEGAALLRRVVADGAAEDGVAGLERVEDRRDGDGRGDVEMHLAVDLGERAEMLGQRDADHRSVCTSTESTAGRSRTMGAHESPASAEPYTCPPVVPKYTPHESSESTAIASRRTFT